MTKFKLFAVVALLGAMTINASEFYRLQCKTEVPTPPTPSPKSDSKGDSKAPSTPRPTK